MSLVGEGETLTIANLAVREQIETAGLRISFYYILSCFSNTAESVEYKYTFRSISRVCGGVHNVCGPLDPWRRISDDTLNLILSEILRT